MAQWLVLVNLPLDIKLKRSILLKEFTDVLLSICTVNRYFTSMQINSLFFLMEALCCLCDVQA